MRFEPSGYFGQIGFRFAHSVMVPCLDKADPKGFRTLGQGLRAKCRRIVVTGSKMRRLPLGRRHARDQRFAQHRMHSVPPRARVQNIPRDQLIAIIRPIVRRRG